jgi:glycerophosphoryl diester phosphodiesterase
MNHICSVCFIFLCCMTATALLAAPPRVEVIAHRGASHDAPENTITALQLGFEQGAQSGELDVWVSHDGHPVVIHDADTKRVAGVAKKVAEQTLAELQTLDVGSWKNAKFAGDKIPTLANALKTIPPERRMFVEIKCGVEGVAPILQTISQAACKPEQIAIISFKAEVIAAVKKSRPDLTAYWILSFKEDKVPQINIEDYITQAKKIGANGLDISHSSLITRELVTLLHKHDLQCYVWTVDNLSTAKKLAAIPVDGITTNLPGKLLEALK